MAGSREYIDLLRRDFLVEYTNHFNWMPQFEKKINDYFEFFERNFYDINIPTLMSLSEDRTCIVRMRWGCYNDGIYQSNNDIISSHPEITEKNIQDSIKSLRSRVLYDLYRKLKYMTSSCKKNENMKIEDLIGIFELGIDSRTVNCFFSNDKKDIPYVLQEFELITLHGLGKFKGISRGTSSFNQIVCAIHDKGYSFLDERVYQPSPDEQSICTKLIVCSEKLYRIRDKILIGGIGSLNEEEVDFLKRVFPDFKNLKKSVK